MKVFFYSRSCCLQAPRSNTAPRAFRGRRRSLKLASGGLFTALALVALSPREAKADPIPGEDFAVQRFNPAPGPRNFFTTRGARIDGTTGFSGGLFLNYAYKPFMLKSCESQTNCDSANALYPEDVAVVENLATADAMAALAVHPHIQLGLRVPVSLVKGQGLSSEGTAASGGMSAVGLGDPELEGKFRLHGDVKDTFVLGAAVFATAPLGHAMKEGYLLGDRTPSAGLRAILDGESGPFSFGGNLVGIYRGESTVGSTALGPEFRYNAAFGFRVSPVLRLIAEGFGGTKSSTKNGTNSLEGLGGVQISPLSSSIAVSAGVGTGIIEGVGVPKVRAFVGIMYAGAQGDRDGDGINDDADQCPTEAEDRDGSEDSDGCPDLDNDGDGIADGADKCLKEPEDMDGFQDGDGCPDPDNDKDGVADGADRCPDKAETKNGFNDEDGCPDEPDQDGDGVADSKDKCPTEAEDTDGFEDTDGCPDPDNDKDGIADSSDECVDEPETKNGFEDADGCPDQAPKKR